MAWRLAGRYVSACSCRNVCPCPTASAPPDNPDGSTNCYGVGVFNIREGNLDDLDLSGINAGIFVHYPNLVSEGNWQIGLFIDEGASEQQAKALEGIFSGQMGGPFGDIAALVSDFLGVERSAVTYSDTSGSFGGSSYRYEPLRGQDGNPTTVKNAPFGFAPEFEIGVGKGTLNLFGHSFAASYGEAADYEYSSELHEQIRA
jgi:hypothetical protein